MENENNILFIGYIEDTLSTPERELFKKRLVDDTSFSEDFEAFKDIYSVLQNRYSAKRANVLESIQNANAAFKSEIPNKSNSKKIISFKPWQMGIAATVLLAIGLFIYNSQGKPAYSDYANPEAIVLTVRSETDSISKKAETTFNSKQYAEAISYFNALLEITPENSEIIFYKAIALVETDNFEEGDVLLKSLSEGKSVYAYKAIYWRALSNLKQNNYEEAKILLKTIPASTPQYKKAKTLLSKLK